MVLPEKISIIVLDDSKTPIPDLIFFMTVKSGNKSDYHIQFPKTIFNVNKEHENLRLKVKAKF